MERLSNLPRLQCWYDLGIKCSLARVQAPDSHDMLPFQSRCITSAPPEMALLKFSVI